VTPVVQLEGVRKNYSGLRPLRVQSLEINEGERVALSGLDAVAAELFVNLLTGAALPDEGVIRTFGSATSDISDGDQWLATLDRFGIVSPRAVILDGATVEQNLAMPFTLQIDPVPPDIAQKIRALAEECGLPASMLRRTAGELTGAARVRVHLARAVALDPKLLFLEHPTADVAPEERVALARNVAAVADARRLTALAITMDIEFAEGMAHRSLVVDGATGAVSAWKKRRGWFR
jgi:ABC-type transporter Mla maintaining outer membrane lipid asymmetry ATPase subunit MlaF